MREVPEEPPALTRADLPAELTAESIRHLPLSTLGRLARPGNGILDAGEQETFDAALHEVMSGTARRLSRQIGASDWGAAVREARRSRRRGGPGRSSRADEQLRRLAARIGEQVDVAEGLAPGVDWSFAQLADPAHDEPAHEPADDEPAHDEPGDPTDPTPGRPAAAGSADAGETVSDLEQRLTDQVELVQVMSEIAEVSRRTYDLEQQRDLQTTRGVFFGFVVSVAVLVAGWAPLVAAEDWVERAWIIGLTLGTCVLAGAVYALVRRWQNARESHDPDEEPLA